MANQSNLTIPEMLAKLNLLYDRLEYVENQICIFYNEHKQLKDDADMVERLIIYQSNKEARKNEVNKLFR